MTRADRVGFAVGWVLLLAALLFSVVTLEQRADKLEELACVSARTQVDLIFLETQLEAADIAPDEMALVLDEAGNIVSDLVELTGDECITLEPGAEAEDDGG
jgi:hypothetical protein